MLCCNPLQLVGVLRWATYVDLVLMYLDLEAGREERVEPYDEIWVAFEEIRHSAYDTRRIDAAWGRRKESECERERMCLRK